MVNHSSQIQCCNNKCFYRKIEVSVFKAIFLLHDECVCVCACLHSEREWVCVYQGLNLALLRVCLLPVTDGHCLILFQSLVVSKRHSNDFLVFSASHFLFCELQIKLHSYHRFQAFTRSMSWWPLPSLTPCKHIGKIYLRKSVFCVNQQWLAE